MKELEPYESFFTTAVRSGYVRYPGSDALRRIHGMLVQVQRNVAPLNEHCANCVLDLMKTVGTLYFRDKNSAENAVRKSRRR